MMADVHPLVVLRDVYNKYAHEPNLGLTLPEFKRLCNRLATKMEGFDAKIAEPAFALFDHSLSGRLVFEDFTEWWHRSHERKIMCGEKFRLLQQAFGIFQAYNTTRQGTNALTHTLTSDQFHNLLEGLGITEADDSVFDRLDEDGDGLVSFEEFCAWLDWF